MALTNGIYKGKGLSLTINATEYNMDIKTATLTSEDKEVITFADMASGAKKWTLTVTALQDMATGSLWRYVWDNAATENIAFVLKPHGNATATATKPHITGTLIVPSKPDWTAEATSPSEVELAFEVTGTPTLAVV